LDLYGEQHRTDRVNKLFVWKILFMFMGKIKKLQNAINWKYVELKLLLFYNGITIILCTSVYDTLY
jgi:hypothetical protein